MTLHYVLWKLPYAVGLRMVHADAVANGVTVRLSNGEDPRVHVAVSMRQQLDEIRAQRMGKKC